MSHADHIFWTENDKYQDLAKRFEQGVTITHPSRAKGECKYLCGPCIWAASTVTYYEYRGESV